MALVRDECLLPCKDAPELGFAKESSPEQYVPDVFYKVRLHPHPNSLAYTSRHMNSDAFLFLRGCNQIFFMCIQKDKDKFGNDVTFLARPLPVEYLIIDVRCALNGF